MKQPILIFILFSILLGFLPKDSNRDSNIVYAGEPESTKIWEAGKHNAFTDLTFFKGKYYCTFREGSGHIPGKKTGEGDGTVRILSSTDGKEWNSVALLKRATFDLRDSKLSITPDGRLMVIMGGSIYVNQKLMERVTQVSFSDENGVNFSEPESVRIDPAVKSKLDWLWRITWKDGIGYGVVYQLSDTADWTVRLLKTTNGLDYSQVVQLSVTGQPNEATVRFAPNGDMKILVRRENGDHSAWLGSSSAPYTKWKWTDIGESLGGPNMIYLPNGTLFLGGRVKGKTGLGTLDEQGKFKLLYTLSSAGDNSYPGFYIQKDTLIVSYYSSHEGKTSIYICRIPLADIPLGATN